MIVVLTTTRQLVGIIALVVIQHHAVHRLTRIVETRAETRLIWKIVA